MTFRLALYVLAIDYDNTNQDKPALLAPLSI